MFVRNILRDKIYPTPVGDHEETCMGAGTLRQPKPRCAPSGIGDSIGLGCVILCLYKHEPLLPIEIVLFLIRSLGFKMLIITACVTCSLMGVYVVKDNIVLKFNGHGHTNCD